MLNFFLEAKGFTVFLALSILLLVLLTYSVIKKPEIPFVDPEYFLSKIGAVVSILAMIMFISTNVVAINPSCGWLIISVMNMLIFGFVLSEKIDKQY